MREIHAILATIAISSIMHTFNEALVLSRAPAEAAFMFLLIGRLTIAAASVSIHKRLSNDKTGVNPLFNIFISIVVPLAVHQFWT